MDRLIELLEEAIAEKNRTGFCPCHNLTAAPCERHRFVREARWAIEQVKKETR